MIEDIQILLEEFDVQGIFAPQSIDHFLINLVILFFWAVLLYVVWKVLMRLF